MLNRSERFIIFLACAALPVLFWPAVGLDEQFYLVKQAGLIILAALMLGVRLAGAAAGARNAPQPRGGAASWAGALVLAWFAASLFYTPHMLSTQQSLAYFAALILLFHLCATHAHGAAARRAAAAGTALGAVITCAYGLLDFFDKAGAPLFINWGSRTASLFSDPNMFGIYLLFPLLLALGRVASGRGASRAAWGGLAALCFAALIASYSRSAWVALGAALAFFAVASALFLKGPVGARIKAAGLAIGLVVALGLAGLAASRLPAVRAQGLELPARLSTISMFHKEEARPRVLLWRSARGMAAAKPLQGYGLGVFWREYAPHQLALRPERGFTERVEERSRHTYNDYLEIRAETGYTGLALWVLFLGAMLWRAAHTEHAADLAPVSAAFGFFMAGALFQYPLFSPAPAALAMVWLGVASARTAPGAPAPSTSGKPLGAAVRALCAVLGAGIVAAALWWTPRQVVGYMYFNKAQALEEKGRAQDALAQYEEAALMQPANAAFQFRLGRALMAQSPDDPFAADRAEQALRASARAFPYLYATHQLLGTLYRRTGRINQALEQMKLAEKYYYEDVTELKRARIEFLMEIGRAGQAAAAQKELVAERPKDPEPLMELARVYDRSEQYDKALRTVEQAETLYGPGHAEPAFEAADILMNKGEYFDAMRRLEPVIGAAEKELSPYTDPQTGRLALENVAPARAAALKQTSARLARALFVTGRCYMAINDPETALPYFHDAHRLDASQSDYVYWGGAACEEQGMTACAVSAYSAILELYPGHRAARQALQRLR
jgi:tetratricopeptide (TPR) repeat protein/O-antigen ligase